MQELVNCERRPPRHRTKNIRRKQFKYHYRREKRRHLGAVIGSENYTKIYIESKFQEWTTCVTALAKIAKTQPHAAYAAFTHGLSSKWTFFLRTIPDISRLLQPLEDAINFHLIPALTGRNSISRLERERELFTLPPHLGGLGIPIPTIEAAFHHTCS